MKFRVYAEISYFLGTLRMVFISFTVKALTSDGIMQFKIELQGASEEEIYIFCSIPFCVLQSQYTSLIIKSCLKNQVLNIDLIF